MNNVVIECGKTTVLVLTRKGQAHLCYIDAEDYGLVKEHYWQAWKKSESKSLYARAHVYRNGTRTTLFMHVLISGHRHNDHHNLNGLDNRKNNLRQANQSQNGANRAKLSNNSSGFKGVSWHKWQQRWQARITVARKVKSLGYFVNVRDAAAAYNTAAIAHFGEFARLNTL